MRTCAAAETPLPVTFAIGLLLSAQTASTSGDASDSSSSRLQVCRYAQLGSDLAAWLRQAPTQKECCHPRWRGR